MKRQEVTLASSPRLQLTTSALIGKVQEVLPTLEKKEEALVRNETSSSPQGVAPGPVTAIGTQQPVVTEEHASQLMQGLKVDSFHVKSKVLKELETAKACLDRASALLMVR